MYGVCYYAYTLRNREMDKCDWGGMERIEWMNRVSNDDGVLKSVKEERTLFRDSQKENSN